MHGAVWPPREAVIPENATVIRPKSVVFTSLEYQRYLAVFGRRNGVWIGIQEVAEPEATF